MALILTNLSKEFKNLARNFYSLHTPPHPRSTMGCCFFSFFPFMVFTTSLLLSSLPNGPFPQRCLSPFPPIHPPFFSEQRICDLAAIFKLHIQLSRNSTKQRDFWWTGPTFSENHVCLLLFENTCKYYICSFFQTRTYFSPGWILATEISPS